MNIRLRYFYVQDDFGEKAQGACVNDFGLTDEDLAMAESLERVAHERGMLCHALLNNSRLLQVHYKVREQF